VPGIAEDWDDDEVRGSQFGQDSRLALLGGDPPDAAPSSNLLRKTSTAGCAELSQKYRRLTASTSTRTV